MKKRYLLLIIFFSIFLCLFLIGSFFDLEISKAIAIPNNFFGILVASVAELPGYGMVAFICGAYFAYTLKYTKKLIWKIVIIAISVFFTVVVVYFQGGAFVSVNAWGYYNYEKVHTTFNLILSGVILIAPCVLFGYFTIKKNDNPEVIYSLVVLSIVLFICFIIPPVLKSFCHRPRFRYLEAHGYELYHPWYRNFSDYKNYSKFGDNEAFQSFPSGHIGTSATIIMSLCFFPKFKEFLKGKEGLLMIIGFVYTLFVAFSRVFVGAHFVTDVSFSGLVCIILMTIGIIIYDLIAKKKNLTI